MADGQFWDTEDPYHSVRFVKGTSKGDCLLVRGKNHVAGIKPEEIDRNTYRELEQWARRRWPQAGEVAWEWGGQVGQARLCTLPSYIAHSTTSSILYYVVFKS